MSDHRIPRTESAYSYPLLIKQLLHCPLVSCPEQEIIYRDQLRFTYRDLHERVCRLANALLSMGVKAGDTVAVMDWDSHRYLECFFAVPMIGAVLHTVNVKLSSEQILYTIDHAEDNVLLVHRDFVPIIEQIKGRIATVDHYILLNDGGEPLTSSVPFSSEYEQWLAEASPCAEFGDFDENTRATTFYTTGTTGMPKGVYFSHRQLVLHTMAVLAALGTPQQQGRIHQGDVYMPITPMFHVHAWGLPYVATALGVKQVYPGRYSPEMLLELIDHEQVTFSHCVPTILHMLFKSPHIDNVDLSRWKVIIGGAAMSRALCAEALQRGIDIFTGYGMSETCPILSLAHLDEEMLALDQTAQAEIRCKTGRTMPLVDVRVVNDKMQEVPRDGQSSGEIVVRAPWLTQGYLKDTRNSENLWQGGYLHTGDVAVRDNRGYLKITDRTKDVIKSGGEWISSLELEDIFSHHPAVAEVAVIAQPDEKWGERPLALVVLKEGLETPPGKRDLLALLHEYTETGVISKQVVLTRVKFVDGIDKTSVGKTDKRTLRDKHLG
ncbi:MAG: long-chain fatty acid--CoA ligase [Desulfuromonas sp.]|jgi:fatty-acyl-CoA synthase|nr:MAG: long-chain fatty acid--CoA ligase [Desulfuromonas sp.]